MVSCNNHPLQTANKALIHFLNLSQLNPLQLQQYRSTVQAAFPPIIQKSEVIISNWPKIEAYFPTHQIFAIDENNNLIGLANTVPFAWEHEPKDLPEEGWDWQVKKSIQDHESNIKPNSLGGLQIIVAKEHQGKGYSKLIIQQIKKIKEEKKYKYLFIPIRPTFKHHHAKMSMDDYLNYKEEAKIYDPWIRTHVNSGAKIIKVCEKSMYVAGSVSFWEELTESKIEASGLIAVKGALNPIKIDYENNIGEYHEPNIWISY